jgi:hypothetical protein
LSVVYHFGASAERRWGTITGVDVRTLLPAAPPTLCPGGGQDALELSDDLVARHDSDASDAAVASFPGERIAVEPVTAAAARREPERSSLGPVYRRTGGGLAVPTGRAFVRFAEGEEAAGHRDELAAAGYELEEVPAYAPHAAWVRPAGGGVVEGLRNLDRLEGLGGVEAVEPELLSEVARKG